MLNSSSSAQMHCCKILLMSAYLHLPDGSQAVPNCISSTAMNYGITWPQEICGVLFCLALAQRGQAMHHRWAHTLSKNGTKVKEKREARERRAFSAQTVEVLFSEQKKRTRLLSIFFPLKKKKRLISRVWVDSGLHEGVTEQWKISWDVAPWFIELLVSALF